MTRWIRIFLFFVSFMVCKSFLIAHDLVEVQKIEPRIEVDLRYKGFRNPLSHPVYPQCAKCFLVREVAEKLARVQRDLEKIGYGLIVLDAYRPYSMQPLLWIECEDWGTNQEPIVCSVEDEDGHNRGTAVDVSLVCLTGPCSLAMPSEFGIDSEKARYDCQNLPAHIYHNRGLLEKAMRQHGFVPSPYEWWHFDYRSFSCYPILDVKFEQLASCSAL